MSQMKKLIFRVLKSSLLIFTIGILACFVLDLLTPILRPHSRPFGHVLLVLENIHSSVCLVRVA